MSEGTRVGEGGGLPRAAALFLQEDTAVGLARTGWGPLLLLLAMDDDWYPIINDETHAYVIQRKHFKRRKLLAGRRGLGSNGDDAAGPGEARSVVLKSRGRRAKKREAWPPVKKALKSSAYKKKEAQRGRGDDGGRDPGGGAPAAASAPSTTSSSGSRAPGGVGARAATATSSGTRGRRVWIGSDCTGLNTISIALSLIGFEVVDEFASEKDKLTRRVLQGNFDDIGTVDSDIFDRDDSRLPSVDLYTAGPPCQSFSSAGHSLGLADARGVVFVRVLHTISVNRPTTFILENVVGLKRNHAAFYRQVLAFLQNITEPDGVKTYKVRARVLDTKIEGGLPQSRPRVYIVGWQRKKEVADFEWPGPVQCASLRSLINVDDVRDTLALAEESRGARAHLTHALKTLQADPGMAEEMMVDKVLL